MSNNSIEIEIKIPLDKDNFLKLKEKLKKTAKFVKTSHQIDEYFTPAHRNFVEPEFPFEWLSIRKRDNKVILNYKHWYPKYEELHTHCNEFETEVKNLDQLQKIFDSLDFKKIVMVEKEREVYVYNNEFEITLDIVKGLGYFTEIEAIKDFGGIEVTRKKIFELAKSLDLDVSKTEKRGYAFLTMKKKRLKNR